MGVPDVHIAVDYVVSDRWCKTAQPYFDERGCLTFWSSCKSRLLAGGAGKMPLKTYGGLVFNYRSNLQANTTFKKPSGNEMILEVRSKFSWLHDLVQVSRLARRDTLGMSAWPGCACDNSTTITGTPPFS